MDGVRQADSVGHIGSWATSEAARKTMRANRSRDTRPEKLLRSELHRRGLRFRVCARPLAGVRRSADVVFTKQRIAVFLDGCFWHGCPEHYSAPKQNVEYWCRKVSTNRSRDVHTDALLVEAGWDVLRIWEHVPVSDAADLVQETVRSLAQGRPRR